MPDADALLEKCRAKYQLVSSLEREEDGHKEKAKALRKQIENHEAEIRRLLTESNQIEMSEGASEAPKDPDPIFLEAADLVVMGGKILKDVVGSISGFAEAGAPVHIPDGYYVRGEGGGYRRLVADEEVVPPPSSE